MSIVEVFNWLLVLSQVMLEDVFELSDVNSTDVMTSKSIVTEC